MSTIEQFRDATLASFRKTLEESRRDLDRAAEDCGTLMQVGALDSFISTFLDEENDLLPELLHRIETGDEPFARQVETSSDVLEYTDRNGCAWLFDRSKPQLGWV